MAGNNGSFQVLLPYRQTGVQDRGTVGYVARWKPRPGIERKETWSWWCQFAQENQHKLGKWWEHWEGVTGDWPGLENQQWWEHWEGVVGTDVLAGLQEKTNTSSRGSGGVLTYWPGLGFAGEN